MPALESTILVVVGFVALGISVLHRQLGLDRFNGEKGWVIPVAAAVLSGLLSIRFELQYIQQTTLGDLHVAGYSVQELLFGQLLAVGIVLSLMLIPYNAGGVWRDRVRWVARAVAVLFLAAIVYELFVLIPSNLEFVVYI